MKVGTRVRFISEIDERYKSMGFYPPIGTLGTVIRVTEQDRHDKQIQVRWDSGTIGDGKWWCYWDEVETVEGEE